MACVENRWEDFVEQRILKPLDMKKQRCILYGCSKNPNMIDPYSLMI